MWRTFCLCLLLLGCGQPAAPRPASVVALPTTPAGGNAAQVKLDRAGRLFLNGKPATVDELKQELARLQQVGGGVRFYHDNPGGATDPQSVEVLRLIANAKVPLRMQNTDFEP